MKAVFGRTNTEYPLVWPALQAPAGAFGESWSVELAAALEELPGPVDVTAAPALWRARLRGAPPRLIARGAAEVAQAESAGHAADLVAGSLMSVLSCLAGWRLELFFLRMRQPLTDAQVEGALEALEAAREDGLIRHAGLAVECHPMAARNAWSFHDGFEVISYRHNPAQPEWHEALGEMARERRVGVLTDGVFDWGGGVEFDQLPGLDLDQVDRLRQTAIRWSAHSGVVQVPVRTPHELRLAMTALDEGRDDDQALAELASTYESPATWHALALSDRAEVRQAALRRLAP